MGNNFNTNAEIRDQDNQADGMKTETAYDTNDDTMIYNSFGYKNDNLKKARKGMNDKKFKNEISQKKIKSYSDTFNHKTQFKKRKGYNENNLASLIPEPTKDSLSDEDFEVYKFCKNGREIAIEQFDNYNDEQCWTLLKDKDGISVYRDEKEKNSCKVKRIADVYLGIDKVKEKLLDINFIKSTNPKIEEIEERAEFSDATKVVYQKMKGNCLVSSRDMCYCVCVFECKNGDVVICNYPIVHNSCPETKCVRGEITSYFYLHKVFSCKTEIRSILHINLKGYIGGTIYNKLASSQYDAFRLLKKSS